MGSPRLSSICLTTVQMYNDTREKSESEPVTEFTCQNVSAWQSILVLASIVIVSQGLVL